MVCGGMWLVVECGLWWSVAPSGVWLVVECGLGWGVACGSFWFFFSE